MIFDSQKRGLVWKKKISLVTSTNNRLLRRMVYCLGSPSKKQSTSKKQLASKKLAGKDLLSMDVENDGEFASKSYKDDFTLLPLLTKVSVKKRLYPIEPEVINELSEEEVKAKLRALKDDNYFPADFSPNSGPYTVKSGAPTSVWLPSRILNDTQYI